MVQGKKKTTLKVFNFAPCGNLALFHQTGLQTQELGLQKIKNNESLRKRFQLKNSVPFIFMTDFT
jgi:hypothetical protein